MLALWLTKLGVTVRIVDRTSRAGTTSRALAVQARTLELYRQVGLADTWSHGQRCRRVNLWVQAASLRVAFETIGAELTPFP